jgi:DNA-binding PadR family transcriptional regulator
MIPFYILGLLQRFGPQHGYQIKKIIGEQLSDFTQIKLPTIYYHLERMEKEGLLLANSEKPGSRPEKTIYIITEKGIEAFQSKITGLLEFEYRPTFSCDGLFYFSDYIKTEELTGNLRTAIGKLEASLDNIRRHKEETLKFIPGEYRVMVNIIFDHHERHYQAELEWAREALNSLIKEEKEEV